MALIKVSEQVNSLFEMIHCRGAGEYAGEAVSQLEHYCQTALLAEKETDDEELILAAFFHDIGNICSPLRSDHTMNGHGTLYHEKKGARFLEANGFSARIVTLVENHVLAKRYLTYKFPGYYMTLTDAGRETLDFEGGPMCMNEAFQFEAHPCFDDIIRLRRWDEMARLPGLVNTDTRRFYDMTMYHLIGESHTPAGMTLRWQK
jgi:2-amino-1-hydroxyethylphosphonate dioxygenase (glycine-forming)